MKTAWAALLLWAALEIPSAAAGLEPIQDGQTLAATLRSLVPSEETAGATLRIRRSSEATRSISLLITSRVETAASADRGPVWSSSYAIKPGQGLPAEFLKVVHRPNEPNLYYYSRATDEKTPWPEPQLLNVSAAGIPFAGSDFALVDLGFEFFYWPKQAIVNRQMRKGRPCKVLESRPDDPARAAYSRVVSWIDNETGGILMAEAYDRAGKRLKDFEVKSVQKVDDAYQIQELRMENLQHRSRTLLEFDLR